MLKDLKKVGKKGVVRDPKVHEEVIHKVIDFVLAMDMVLTTLFHKAMEEYITKKQKELMLKKKNKKLLN